MLIAEETNTIETAYLRLQLLPQQAQPALQELFRRYVDPRLETYRRLPDMAAAEMEMAKSKQIQEEIWAEAVAATRLPDSHPSAGLLLLPALNNMIDISTTPYSGAATSPSKDHLCASIWPGSDLFAAGWFSDVERPTPELAAHPRFHSSHGHHRVRNARRRVPARGFIGLESDNQLLVHLREHMK